ncbi:MAG: hypothetical protein QOE63_1531 [Acidimicrobiaceae bacterium]|jgi:hypothetical protein
MPATVVGASVDDTNSPGRHRNRTIAIVACALVLAAGLVGAASDIGSGGPSASTSAAAASSSSGAPASSVLADRALSVDASGKTAEGFATGGSAAGPATADQAASTVAAPPADGARIVKNGSMELGIGKGTLQDTLDKITNTATALGGYVASTQTSGGGTADTRASGQLAVRVPAASFEQLVSGVRRLGEVRSVTTSGTDVTAQFTDMDARIGALSATRDQLLLLLSKANTIGDVLQVQDRITQVQSDLDALSGQRKLLDDQASMATLTVDALEPGASVAITPVSNHTDLGDSWQTAKDRFVDSIAYVIEGVGTVGFLAILALGGWLAYKVVVRRRRLVPTASA